jgi:hypothetical protein
MTLAAADGCSGSNGALDGAALGLPDGSTFDASVGQGGGSDDANACRPGDVETYQPGAYLSATAAWQGVCRQDLISGFYDACLGAQATLATCTAFKSDRTAARCAECILTPDDQSNYGPLIDHGTFITANVAGCIELTDPAGLSCAKKLQALSGCELAACEANCPVEDEASRAAYDVCVGQADGAGCQSYEMAASCIGSEGDSGLVASCLIPTFAEFYDAVVPLFCGPPRVDGGVAPFDASAAGPPEAAADGSSDARGSGGDAGGARLDAAADAPADASRPLTDASRAPDAADAAKE